MSKSSKPLIPKESEEQEVVMAWAMMMEGREPRLVLLNASMSGILTGPAFGAKLKRLGRKKGYPDLFLPVYVDGPEACGHAFHSGLFIELKRLKGGVVDDDQKWWHEKLRDQCFRVEVCLGAKAAIAIIKSYLEMKD